MTNNIAEIPELISKCKHTSNGYVKFHEVDHFNVVHNLTYLQWTEVARVEYCRHIDISILPTNSDLEKKFSIYLVHSEVNYFNPASFFDNYIIHTRVLNIGKTSITFEHIVAKEDGTPLCINDAVEVYVDENKRPMLIPEEFRNKIVNFENCI